MAVGNLALEILLDRQSAVYNGHEDPIHGHASLSFHPSTFSQRTEFFGPLRLELILQGTLKTRLYAVHGSSKSRYTQERTLFKTIQLLHNGPFRIQAGQKTDFPFIAYFPQYADDTTHDSSQRNSLTRPTPRRQKLPPTFSRRFHRHRVRSSKAQVKYELKAVIAIPGIDIDINYVSPPQNLQFEQPHPHPDGLGRTNVLGNRFAISTKQLIAPDQRKKKCWQKVYAGLLTLPPKHTFFVCCTKIPQDIFVGERLVFELEVHHNTKNNTQPIPPGTNRPTIFLQQAQISILPSTLLYPSGNRYGHKEFPEPEQPLSLTNFDPSIPLSKEHENYASKIIVTEPLGEMCSSFKLGRLTHFHRLRIRFVLIVWGEKVCFDAARGLRVHARPNGRLLLGDEAFDVDMEELPGYE